MLLTDLIATKITIPAVVAAQSIGSYQVGAGSAAADGVVGFTIDDADIFFIPGSGATAIAIGAELADIANATGSLLWTAVDDGAGLVSLKYDIAGQNGNSSTITEATTDTGVAAGTIIQPAGGVNAEESSAYAEVTDSVNTAKVTIQSLTSNSSMVRRILAKAGMSHDLESGSTSNLISHAICLRILEQL